jgi:hypothetical protein
MTHEKARDFFSAYYEDSLEPNLRVSFEQKLKADPNLRDDYDAFVRAINQLDGLKMEEIAIPEDLHERISARLDRHIYDRNRNAAPAWNTWLRGFAFAGIGAVAILGAFFTLNNRGGDVTGSGMGWTPPARETISYTVSSNGVTFKFAPVSQKTVVVTDGQGKELSRSTIGDQANPALNTLLSNPLPTASVFGIQVVGEAMVTYIAVPGKLRASINAGEGTVIDLAKAISDFYRMPVKIQTAVPNERTSWSFSSTDAVTESSKALGANYQVTLLQNNMLEAERK